MRIIISPAPWSEQGKQSRARSLITQFPLEINGNFFFHSTGQVGINVLISISP